MGILVRRPTDGPASSSLRGGWQMIPPLPLNRSKADVSFQILLKCHVLQKAYTARHVRPWSRLCMTPLAWRPLGIPGHL